MLAHDAFTVEAVVPSLLFDMCCCCCCQVHISHVGQMRFKGVAQVQSVMQFSTAHLSSRQFPADPPSAKAELVKLCSSE